MRNSIAILFGAVIVFGLLYGEDTKAPAWDPGWLKGSWILGCAAVVGWLALSIAFVNADDPPPKQSRHESDRWTGRCYMCGDAVTEAQSFAIHSGGKPPKRFCYGCRDQVAT